MISIRVMFPNMELMPCYRHMILFVPVDWSVPYDIWNNVLLNLNATQSHRADSRFSPSQWETALLCNDVSHWLGANLESAMILHNACSIAMTKSGHGHGHDIVTVACKVLGTHLSIVKLIDHFAKRYYLSRVWWEPNFLFYQTMTLLILSWDIVAI